MSNKQNVAQRCRHWVSGSIQRKLTLFVVLLCLVLVALVWVLGINLIQPVYYDQIRQDIEQSMNTVVSILQQAENDGIPITQLYSSDGITRAGLSEEVQQRILAADSEGLIKGSVHSIDVAGEDMLNLFWMGPLTDNVLHPAKLTVQGVPMQLEVDGPTVTLLRMRVYQEGSFYGLLTTGQMAVGTLTPDGLYSVIVATNIERIPQAVNVMKRLMLPILLTLIFVSVLAALVFSRWFTGPISRLSAAARQMSKGNYDVHVEPQGCDEIAELSCDFNEMARDVKRSADLQRDLLANVSHDLRTPLTLIKGYAETVRDLTGDEPAKREQQLNVIIDESDRLSSLVGSVLELSRVSSGHEKLEPVQFNLTQLCDEVAYRYKEISEQQGGIFDFEGDWDCMIVADPTLIERVLHNLLGNARKHTGEDRYMGLHVLKTDHGTARVEVIDHGHGVAEKDKPYLFDRYYRSRDDAGKAGTGLGLSITKAILQAHKFAFGVESQEGQGATFWFEAPLAERSGR